ncbi:hypothetical protein JOC34_001808 [Virgibacillus halotolerans]|nr:hypothetical protein [Virgibacillus halotolerans]
MNSGLEIKVYPKNKSFILSYGAIHRAMLYCLIKKSPVSFQSELAFFYQWYFHAQSAVDRNKAPPIMTFLDNNNSPTMDYSMCIFILYQPKIRHDLF